MTSLGYLQYSEINDNSAINATELDKKKQARHNITIKKRHEPAPPANNDNVQNMLKLINNSNGYENETDESGLADFNPPPRAEVSSKTESVGANGIGSNGIGSNGIGSNGIGSNGIGANSNETSNVNIDYEKPINVIPPPRVDTTIKPRQYPAPLDSYDGYALPKTYASDYYRQYVPSFNQNDTSSQPINKNQLLEKLNYMIHLLEEQKDEKTGHVMEEVILYSFLGVFIIFIVDSFARVGKYTR